MTAIVTRPQVVIPPYVIPQQQALEHLRQVRLGQPQAALALRLAANMGVETRHSVLPFEQVVNPGPLEERNALHLKEAVALGAQAAERALLDTGTLPA